MPCASPRPIVPPKLGILAGRGDLPAHLATACQTSGRDYFVIGFHGETDGGTLVADANVDIAAVGKMLALLKKAGCEEVVLAGPIRRPSLRALRPDRRGAVLMGKLLRAPGGDDGLLSVVVAELEGEGFRVIGADDVLADLAVSVGSLGKHRPDGPARQDIKLAIRVLRALGEFDVGQAAVVQQGRVLGVEAAEGTDALIARCGAVRLTGRGGVLVKLKKPGQERRVDLPTIGPLTVEAAARTGLVGIAVEAHGSLVLDRAVLTAAADRAKMFVVAVPSEGAASNRERSR